MLTSIHRYLVKSCQGESLDTATVEPWGLAGDRRWMVCEPDGKFVTARTDHRLLTITPTLTAAGLRLGAPGFESVEVATPTPENQVPVQIWKSEITAAATVEANDWLAEVLGRKVQLLYLDDPTRRQTDPAFSEPGDRVSFADGYPLLLTTEGSLAALNEAITAYDDSAATIEMSRFRPSVVVSDTVAWAEDDWRRVRLGDATFRAVKGCARCVMTTLTPDFDTGEVTGSKEPTRTLARLRRFDSGVWFGVNLIPETAGATISVGDEFEVLESVPPGNGPLRG